MLPVGRRILELSSAALISLGAAVAVYWQPLIAGWGAIQWDTVGVHLWNLVFSSQWLSQGVTALWTPHLFGGFPQIADPQVAFWYPPVLAGLLWGWSPRVLLGITTLHYALASFSMYLLARRLRASWPAAVALGLAYAWGGFMAGHASHVGMQSAAAWLPLVFLCALEAQEKRSWRWALACGLALGVSILAGHSQVSLYMALIVGLWGLWIAGAAALKRSWHAAGIAVGLAALSAVVAIGVSAIQYLPTAQLVARSNRSAISLDIAQTESLKPASLRGLVDWNFRGVATGPYTGPWDRTQNYLYPSLAVLAAATVGAVLALRDRKRRILAGFLVFIAFFGALYALGPAGGIQSVLYHVPLLGRLRAPSNMMLLTHFSLMALAAMAMASLPQRRAAAGGLLLLFLVAVDLAPKTARNELLWARAEPWSIYSNEPIALEAQKFSGRIWQVAGLAGNEPQYYGLRDFGGYNPLQSRAHADYEHAMAQRPDLAALAGIRFAPCSALGGIPQDAPWAPDTCRLAREPYPYAFFTDAVHPGLGDPIPRVIRPVSTDSERPSRIHLEVDAPRDGYLVLTEASYPGWKVFVDGTETKLMPVNGLFMAAAVSPGEHTVTFRFVSPALLAGAVITFLTLLGCAAALVLGHRKR